MSFGNGCSIDYLAVAKGTQEPQESQLKNLNDVGCSKEGLFFQNGCNIGDHTVAKETQQTQESQLKNLNEVGCSRDGSFFGSGCNIDYLAVAKEIPEPQESPLKNLNEVGCSQEGLHMTVPASLVKEFQLLHPPEFKGSSDIAVAEEWFSDIEKKLGLMSATDEQRVTLATAMLKGEASHWWDINKYTMIIEGMTWREFVDSFLERYYPFSDRNMKKIELMRLVRKEFWDRVEKKIEKRKAGKSDQSPQQKKQRNWPLANLYSEPIVTTEEKVCFICKEVGHLKKHCPLKMQDPNTNFSTLGSNLVDPNQGSTLDPDSSSTLNPNPNPSPSLNSNSSHSHSPTSIPKIKQEPQPEPSPPPQQQQHPFNHPRLLMNSQGAQQTIVTNRCYNCRQKGHLANDCPLLQQLHPQQQLQHRQLRHQQRLQKHLKKQKRQQLKQQQKHTQKFQQPEIAHVEVNMEEFWESEKKRKMGKTKFSPSCQNQEEQQHPPYTVPQPALTVKGQQVLCFRCKQTGHYAKDCTQQQVHCASASSNILMDRQELCFKQELCFRCKQPGHYVRDCPQPHPAHVQPI